MKLFSLLWQIRPVSSVYIFYSFQGMKNVKQEGNTLKRCYNF